MFRRSDLLVRGGRFRPSLRDVHTPARRTGPLPCHSQVLPELMGNASPEEGVDTSPSRDGISVNRIMVISRGNISWWLTGLLSLKEAKSTH